MLCRRFPGVSSTEAVQILKREPGFPTASAAGAGPEVRIMALEYTPAVAAALEAAAALARHQGEPGTLPLHLLQALLREEEGRAWQLLTRAGADPDGLRASLPAGTADLTAPAEPPLPRAPALDDVLAQARRLAREHSQDSTVPSELVLLALLRQDAAARQALEQLGLDVPRLEDEVLALNAPPLKMDEPLELGDWTEQVDTARILDAAANRAREALRVVEDYCRFVLDDALLTGELKQLRHDLTEALAGLPPELLLAARDTEADVGTALATKQEGRRHSLHDVVRAACKRLQEALRTLEELGKLRGPGPGQRLAQMRYRAYTLERAVVLGEGTRLRLAEARLYVLVTGAVCAHGLERTIHEAAAGGAQVFQLREKGLADRDLLDRARRVRRWTRQAGALFILNDRPDLARLAEADGVHLGQVDLSVRDARRIIGPGALVGVSTHDRQQLRRAVLDAADYVGVGPTFASETKAFAEFPGLDFVRQATATTLPAFAIGGITVGNVEAVVAAGARRAAVSRAVCQAEDPQAAAAALRRVLDRAWVE
jgi:thiamine-phosphate pyrophosphorylase